MKIVHLDTKTPNPGHYSPGVISHGILYVSGQLPKNLDTGKLVEGGIEVQTKQALLNVKKVIEVAHASLQDVVLCRVYISDMKQWDIVNSVYAQFFGPHKPARVVVPTRELHFGALVEIEAMVEINE